MATAGAAVRQLERRPARSGSSANSEISGDKTAPDPGGDGKAKGTVPPEKGREEAAQPSADGSPGTEQEGT